ncbi:MAG: hypothetical protein JXA11_09270 [Phycisphaerae bacterium]|nr:hypothetical protein [Phycisphaerae bacterium]
MMVAGAVSFCAAQGNSPAPDDTAAKLRQHLARQVTPATLEAVWYRPHVEHKGKTNPVAVILASKDFPASTKDFWVPTLWKENYCTLVVTTQPPDQWSSIRLAAVLREIQDAPEEVPADTNRLLLIADTKTGPLATRLLETYPTRVIGAVFISFTPTRITPTGPGLWQPTKDVWSIPIWSVVGTKGKSTTKVLELWRKLAARAPAEAPLCVDPRLGRRNGHLLPDETILPWIQALWNGKTPAPGPDRQAEAERKQFADLAKQIRQAVQQRPTPLPAGESVTKTEGPFRLSVQTPEGWWRDRDGEKAYNPQGPRTDKLGRIIAEDQNPYAEIYLTPKRRGPFFVRLRAAESQTNGETLLKDFEKLVAEKGYLPVSLERWNQDGRLIDVSVYLLAWEGNWHRWVVLTAVSHDTPVAPLIMVMDASDAPDPRAMATAMRSMLDSVRVEKINPDKPKSLD